MFEVNKKDSRPMSLKEPNDLLVPPTPLIITKRNKITGRHLLVLKRFSVEAKYGVVIKCYCRVKSLNIFNRELQIAFLLYQFLYFNQIFALFFKIWQ